MKANDALAGLPVLGHLPDEVLLVLAWMAGALLLGTLVRLAGYAVGRRKERALIRSLESWWILAVVFTLALAAGRSGIVVLTAGLGLVGLDEYLRLAGRGLVVRLGAATSVVLVHAWALLDWSSYFWIGFPAAAGAVVLLGAIGGARRLWSSTAWGVLACGFCLAQVQGLFALEELVAAAPAGGLGLVLFVVLATEINDIAQALWGRRFGRRPIAPTVSPRKTWEGLLGGLLTTIAVSLLLAPRLLPPSSDAAPDSAAASLLFGGLTGALVALAGIVGDLAMSVVKRRAGVADSGTLLPGQGGALDRIDSLTLSAPIFAYWIALGWR